MAEMKTLPCKTTIAIMGAGAIGSVIGGMLARQGHKVTLVGRRQRPKKE
jgi:2-dehydropantoate 2-reductase